MCHLVFHSIRSFVQLRILLCLLVDFVLSPFLIYFSLIPVRSLVPLIRFVYFLLLFFCFFVRFLFYSVPLFCFFFSVSFPCSFFFLNFVPFLPFSLFRSFLFCLLSSFILSLPFLHSFFLFCPLSFFVLSFPFLHSFLCHSLSFFFFPIPSFLSVLRSCLRFPVSLLRSWTIPFHSSVPSVHKRKVKWLIILP